jgi:two-component system, OmpR family, sensor histidine kinase KdpD
LLLDPTPETYFVAMKPTVDELLARIPHDVRSPLLVISATAAVLRETVGDELRPAVDKILREAQRIDRMLENRTTAVRLAAGHQIKREWITVEELVGGAIARVEPLIGGRRVEHAVDAGAVAHVEARLVEIVIANLIDNAFRYAGGVLVIAGRSDAREAIVEVVDAGPGSAALAPTGPTSGLAVARAIVACHGGALEIIAREPGSMVRVRLPHAGVPPTLHADEEELD